MPRDKAMAECWQFVALYLAVFYSKVQTFCWPKGTSLECVESIYVKTTETACVSDELCCFKEEEEEEEEDGQIVSLGDSRIYKALFGVTISRMPRTINISWVGPRVWVVSQASRIFPSGVRMRVNKFCVGGEGNIRLVTVARFSCRLPKIW